MRGWGGGRDAAEPGEGGSGGGDGDLGGAVVGGAVVGLPGARGDGDLAGAGALGCYGGDQDFVAEQELVRDAAYPRPGKT